jgi:hypothetical protein
MTALPPSKSNGEDERSVLYGYLDYHRAVLARKAEGVNDEDARRAACPPSAMTLIGLIRHMADVERYWFRRWFASEDLAGLFEEDGEWRIPPDAGIADALDLYWAEIAASDRNIKPASLDAVGGPFDDSGEHSLRRTIVHMIEEYARHCGHADLLREAIDGATGD